MDSVPVFDKSESSACKGFAGFCLPLLLFESEEGQN
jgi:hypothetical protein